MQKILMAKACAILFVFAMSGSIHAAEKMTICKSFTFSINKDEWLEVRRLMHEISIESAGNPPFFDRSYEDPVGRRYLKLSIERKGVNIINRLDASIYRDGEKAVFAVFDLSATKNSSPCGLLISADYEIAKAKFSKRWSISESTENQATNPQR